MAIHRLLRRHALGAARFITLTGTTRTQRVFWRSGAAISAFGGFVVIASEVGTLAALLTISAWRSLAGSALLLLHLLIAVMSGYFVNGLIRGIREPLSLNLRNGPRT